MPDLRKAVRKGAKRRVARELALERAAREDVHIHYRLMCYECQTVLREWL